MENLIGLQIDNYQIISTLGKGGMGVVYKAYDTQLDREVAIKMMSSKMFDNERMVNRFKNEAKNQAKLLHPNIVTVYGFIEYSDLLGIVMEMVEGDSLEKVLYNQKRFSIYDTVFIMKQILAGLAVAHGKGFVHRDIKPPNIIFNHENVAKLMDFGISKSNTEKKFTKTGSKIGTVYYMAPEQIRGEDVSPHTDIYSLGCTIYEMLTGVPPFYYKSEYEIMDAHVNKQPKLVSEVIPGMPQIVDEVVIKAMSKDPYQRYHSCEEFAAALEQISNFIENVKRETARKKEVKQKNAKRFSLVGLFAFVGVGLVIAYLVLTQAMDLVESGKIEEFERHHGVQSWFDSGEAEKLFSKQSRVNSGVREEFNRIGFSGNTGYLLGGNGTVLISTNNGGSWNKKDFKDNSSMYDAHIFKNGSALFVGDSGRVYFSDSEFRNFRKIDIGVDNTLFRIEFIDERVGFISGSRGLLYRTTDGGNTWSRIGIETSQNLFDIDFVDNKTGYVVGWSGVIFRTNDMGLTWTALPKFTQNYLKSVIFLSEDVGLAVGGKGTLYRTNNGAKSWRKKLPKFKGGLSSIKQVNDKYTIAVGSRGALFYSPDRGKNWYGVKTKSFVNFNDLDVNSFGKVYIAGVNGTILKLF